MDRIIRAAEPSFVHGDWVQVYVDPDPAGMGPGHIRIEERHGALGVAVLPVWEDRIGLVKLFRRTIGEFALEIPRGFGGESGCPRSDAARELYEETGISIDPADLVDLGHVRANTGILGSEVAVFMARLGSYTPVQIPDSEEVSEFEWFDLDQVMQMIAADGIVDAFTCTAVIKAFSSRKLPLAHG